jgi:hypothetical protein
MTVVEKGALGRSDIFSQLWCLYKELSDWCADDTAFRSLFFQQSSRPRFMYDPMTRQRLLKRADQLDATASTRRLSCLFSEHFDTAKGIWKSIGDFAHSLR